MGIYLGGTELSSGGGGGGGFTNMKKYVTGRSLDDATNKLGINVSGKVGASISGGGQTSFQWYSDDTNADQQALVTVQDALVGYTFNIGYGTQTVTGNTGAGFGTNQTLSFTPAVAGGVSANQNTDLVAPTYFTVNPATDLGLEDGANIYIFMVSGGQSSNTSTNGGQGGRILQKTKTISNASTNLVLTIGVGANGGTTNLGSDSTISGGLTLTTSDGYNGAGLGHNSTSKFTGEGINAYGLGGGTQSNRGGGTGQHGWGNGNFFGGGGGDGAILLFY